MDSTLGVRQDTPLGAAILSRGTSMIKDRRRFLARAGGAMAAVAAATIVDAHNVIAQPKIQWRMSTAWPPALKVMQGSAVRLRKIVEEMTSGRFRIEVFAGGKPPRAPSKPSWLLRPTGRTGSSRSSGSRPSRSA